MNIAIDYVGQNRSVELEFDANNTSDVDFLQRIYNALNAPPFRLGGAQHSLKLQDASKMRLRLRFANAGLVLHNR